MNILINGSSISRGPGSWPYYLKAQTNSEIVNLAQAGAGYTYIHETTITEISQRTYDLALVMWPESGRLDFRAKDIQEFSDSKNTSLYQSNQNDWPEKIVYPINDQDYVQKDWIFSLGYLQKQSDSVAKIFKPCHAVTSHRQILETELIQLISLQGVLKAQGIPYQFMFWQPYKQFHRFENYYKMIDWSNVYTNTCLEDIAISNNWLAEDKKHPSAKAHELYADYLVKTLSLGK